MKHARLVLGWLLLYIVCFSLFSRRFDVLDAGFVVRLGAPLPSSPWIFSQPMILYGVFFLGVCLIGRVKPCPLPEALAGLILCVVWYAASMSDAKNNVALMADVRYTYFSGAGSILMCGCVLSVIRGFYSWFWRKEKPTFKLRRLLLFLLFPALACIIDNTAANIPSALLMQQSMWLSTATRALKMFLLPFCAGVVASIPFLSIDMEKGQGIALAAFVSVSIITMLAYDTLLSIANVTPLIVGTVSKAWPVFMGSLSLSALSCFIPHRSGR